MKIKEEIYKLMDSFLVEGDQPRSIERLNQDRHLFVENMLDVVAKEKMELVKKIEEFICDPNWDRDRSVAGILRELEAPKPEEKEEVGK